MSQRAAKKRATLKDIAEEVGVSTGTVSVVLNGARSGTSVADRTRDAIHASAQRLGYRPNWVAKSLRGGRTRTIGLIPTQAVENFLLGPHIQRLLNSVTNVLAAHHYDLLLLTRCDQSDVRGVLEGVVNGRIDGAIVVAPLLDSRLAETLVEAGFPFVVIDGAPGTPGTTFNVNDAEGTQLGYEHLRSLGHTRIGYIAGPQTFSSARSRLAGFLEVTEDPSPLVDYGDYRAPSGHEIMTRWLELPERPTAVLCANDEMAAGAMRAAREAGLTIPEDLSVVGFDDSPSSPDLQPPLTTFAQPVEEMGTAAAKAILEALDHPALVQSELISGRFIVRHSTTGPKKDNIQ